MTMQDIHLSPIVDATMLDRLVDKIDAITKRHALGKGAYARWLWQDSKNPRQLGINEYGCADAVNILYTIGRLPNAKDPEREGMIEALRSLQKPDGSFTEVTHHVLHTTAHCIAALQILDAQPVSPDGIPCAFLRPYRTKEGLYALLDGLPWEASPWSYSHQGAGVYTAMQLTGCADREWQDWYFDWLWHEVDPIYGMGRAGRIGYSKNDPGRLENIAIAPTETHPHADLVRHQLNGWFHYMFNMEYARRPQRYPEQLIDTCLHLWESGGLGQDFGRTIGFREIDWVFVLHRTSRQTPHRYWETRQALADFASQYLPWLDSLDIEAHDGMNDLHMLFGMVCALAELQLALPGKLPTTVPLHLVLDRRPFI